MTEPRAGAGKLAPLLSRPEEGGAAHGDLRVPLPAVPGVQVPGNASGPTDHGLTIGKRLPGAAKAAAARGGRMITGAVRQGMPRGTGVLPEGACLDRRSAGCEDPGTAGSRTGGTS
jgi:hypothetical protein